MARQCLVAVIRHQSKGESSTITEKGFVAIKENSPVLGCCGKVVKCEELEKIIIDNDEGKFFQVGVQLPPREKEELVVFLRKNVDVFVWSAYETPGVDSNFICHHLNVNLSITPKKQLPRHSSKEHSNVVKEEVTKLK